MKKRDYLERILNARVYDVAVETPLEVAPNLTRRLGNTVLLKREDVQPVFSFKLRGAYNKMAQLSADKLDRGVITASAGNHAQGVALAAQRLGCKATIVMPVTTPQIKVDAVRARGATVVLHGDSYSDAYEEARKLEQSEGLTFVHPYDDPDVIAGQGTIALEILRQRSGPIHAIFVPIGGGGLIGGIAAWYRGRTKVVGVEPETSRALQAALEAGAPTSVSVSGIATDSLGASRAGDLMFPIAQAFVDRVTLVNDRAIRDAQRWLWEHIRIVAEPGGATALAALLSGAYQPAPRERIGVVLCGANTEPETFAKVIANAL